MTAFTYRARDINGLLVTGEIDGETTESIRENLAEQGLIPLSVSQGAGKINVNVSLDVFNFVSAEELMLFTRQFYTLFKAGMDMESLLTTLANQTKNKFFQESLIRIKTDVANGSSLSRAFSQHPKIFDDLYINMLSTGEEAGILDQSLEQLNTILDKEQTLKAAVSSATLYPKIVLFVLVCAATVMLTFVVPKFETFFAVYNAQLPLPTRILMGTSEILRNYWYLCLIGLGVLIFLFRKWTATSKGKLTWDKIKWHLPVFGPLSMKVANARFANILASLYKAGIPITRGLDITSKTIGNEAFSQDIRVVRNDVEKGRGIAESMRESHYFSPLITESTAIGEKSGSLDEMYISVGSHYDMEVQHTLKKLTTLLEPLMLFFVFGMVTVFALAIFLPMWNLSSVVMKH